MLKILDPPHLVRLEATKLFAPSIIRDLGHADLADRIRDCAALRCQNIHLTQLNDDLLWLVSLTHLVSSSGGNTHTLSRTTSTGEVHYETQKTLPPREKMELLATMFGKNGPYNAESYAEIWVMA